MVEYTKYEKARILGARALQIAMNAPLLLNLSKEQLEEVAYDPLKIAEIEFDAGILPITVKRPFPKKEDIEEEIEEIIKEEEGEAVVEKAVEKEAKAEAETALVEVTEPEEPEPVELIEE